MIPFLVAEALRRARRQDHRDRPQAASGPPMWRLLAGEGRHLVTSWVVAPRAAAALCGVVAAIGLAVALGPGYPGPVAPTILRGMLAMLAAGAGVALARTAPSHWRDLPRAVRRARVGLAAVLAGAAISVLKVGLHEVTPGPVLPGPARWTATIVVVVGAVLLAAGHHQTQDGSSS